MKSAQSSSSSSTFIAIANNVQCYTYQFKEEDIDDDVLVTLLIIDCFFSSFIIIVVVAWQQIANEISITCVCVIIIIQLYIGPFWLTGLSAYIWFKALMPASQKSHFVLCRLWSVLVFFFFFFLFFFFFFFFFLIIFLFLFSQSSSLCNYWARSAIFNEQHGDKKLHTLHTNISCEPVMMGDMWRLEQTPFCWSKLLKPSSKCGCAPFDVRFRLWCRRRQTFNGDSIYNFNKKSGNLISIHLDWRWIYHTSAIWTQNYPQFNMDNNHSTSVIELYGHMGINNKTWTLTWFPIGRVNYVNVKKIKMWFNMLK